MGGVADPSGDPSGDLPGATAVGAPVGLPVAAPVVVPEPPPGTEVLLGAAEQPLRRYAALLATAGIERGLIGPREVPRLWERHLFNCLAVATLLPERVRVVDVGTGAGLPGLVLAIARPDLDTVLLDATARRTAFLTEAVGELGLGARVRVVTGRVEDPDVRAQAGPADVVVSRAVAPLPKLVGWCLPLLRRGGTVPDGDAAPGGGTVLAMKGARARDEVQSARDELRRAGAEVVEVHDLELGGQTTTVVELRRTANGRRRGVTNGRRGKR